MNPLLSVIQSWPFPTWEFWNLAEVSEVSGRLAASSTMSSGGKTTHFISFRSSWCFQKGHRVSFPAEFQAEESWWPGQVPIFPTEVADPIFAAAGLGDKPGSHRLTGRSREELTATFAQHFFIFLLYFNGKLDGSMTMYDYVWLCMTMYDYVWLCMTMYDLNNLKREVHHTPMSWADWTLVAGWRTHPTIPTRSRVLLLSASRDRLNE